MNKRTVTTYLVLEKRGRGFGYRAMVVGHLANPPTLKRGQCAVRLEIAVPIEAFEPVFFMFFKPAPIDVDLGGVLRAASADVTITEPQP